MILKNICLFVGLFLFLSGCSTSSNIASDTDDVDLASEDVSDMINIGVILPRTELLVSFGDGSLNVINYVINKLNLDGGIKGKKINLIVKDSKCSEKYAGLAAKELIEENDVKYIIGGLCSSETIGASKFTEKNKVILFSALSSSKKISELGDFVFRTAVSDTAVSRSLSEFAIKNGHDEIMIYSDDSDFSKNFRTDFILRYEELGGKVTFIESFVKDSHNLNHLNSLEQIKNSDTNSLLFMIQDEVTYNLVISEMKNLGVSKNIYTYEIIESAKSSEGVEDYLDGAYYALPFVDKTLETSKNLIRNLNLEYDLDIEDLLPLNYILSTYDLVNILFDVIENCGEDTTCAQNYLNSLENYNGYMGNFSFDPNGDVNLEPKIYTFSSEAEKIVG